MFATRRPLLGENVIAERVAARLVRQALFGRKPLPTISFVIEEAVLRRPIGGWTVWRGQLGEIMIRGTLRNVEVQITPTEVAEHAAMAGPFALIETENGRRVAYLEVQNDVAVFLSPGHPQAELAA
ncbi:Scr1 family TA system antitoxin-like transcriptional regulator [Streptomyces sp. KLOTTS4A1]|uniref:Scr1 family TA system antitoxin-like transcriptional regulator n=1 Tax=Streptomyces sp. KLOTTS4A1 TaxID=3390996 RepID=UPI0039F565D4